MRTKVALKGTVQDTFKKDGISVPGSASMGPINISFPHVDSAYQHLC